MTTTDSWFLDIPSFVLGFIISGILGNILQNIRRQRSIMEQPNRQMPVYTTLTPNQVQRAAQNAYRSYLGWWLLLILFIAALFGGFYLLLQGNGWTP